MHFAGNSRWWERKYMRDCTKIKFGRCQILKIGGFPCARRSRLGQKLAATREEEEAGEDKSARWSTDQTPSTVILWDFGILPCSVDIWGWGCISNRQYVEIPEVCEQRSMMDWTGTTRSTDAKEIGQEHSNPGAAGKVSRVIWWWQMSSFVMLETRNRVAEFAVSSTRES